MRISALYSTWLNSPVDLAPASKEQTLPFSNKPSLKPPFIKVYLQVLFLSCLGNDVDYQTILFLGDCDNVSIQRRQVTAIIYGVTRSFFWHSEEVDIPSQCALRNFQEEWNLHHEGHEVGVADKSLTSEVPPSFGVLYLGLYTAFSKSWWLLFKFLWHIVGLSRQMH